MKNLMIVTLQGMGNYGNRLQNYALTFVLKNNFGYKVFNYLKKEYISKFRLYMSYILKKNYANIRYLLFLKFNKLYSNDILFDDSMNTDSIDYSIAGSDQVWNPYFVDKPEYFCKFVPSNKRIAYSASFGVSEISDEHKEKYKKNLSEMNAVSVREDSGAKIIKELTGRDVPVLIDPTMMLTKDEWRKITKKPKFVKKNEKFILTYFLGDVSNQYREYIENIANDNNCEIINLELHNTNRYWYFTGPSEFVWLIDNCTAMFTDSFHGSVFSILMDTPFIVFDRDGNGAGMGSRIDTLLDKFDLNDRKFSNQNIQQVLNIDYSHIEPILNVERKKSIDFLKDAMEM